MTTFQVRGLNSQGELELKQVRAGSRQEAESYARQSGLRVLDVRGGRFQGEAGGLVGGLRNGVRFSQFRRFARFDLALFAHELVALLSAGLSLIETLETLAERQEHSKRSVLHAASRSTSGLGPVSATGPPSNLLSDLVRQMQEGKAFSAALRSHPAVFPELFIASVAASEQTGEIVPALQRYLRYHEQVGVIRQKIISASLYPAMLCAVGTAVTLFLLCFLVPRFSRVYEGMEDKLPWASRWLMQWGLWLSQHWGWALGGMGLLVMALPFVLARPIAREWMGTALQSNRFIGEQIKLMQLSRFYRSLGLLLGGGISVLKAMHMAQGLLPLRLQASALAATQQVSQGQSLSESLQAATLTTPVALRLLRAGERNGQIAQMLEQAASFHDKEIANWIDRFAKLFEPVLMLLIGLAIGGIVIMLYLPIFELAGSLG